MQLAVEGVREVRREPSTTSTYSRHDGGGRPAMGSGPAEVVPVRLDPELKAAVEARAEADHTTTSDVIREALRRFLEVA